MGASAVSHCERVSDAGMAAMAEAGVVAVLLPTTAYILRLEPPPARALIDKGTYTHTHTLTLCTCRYDPSKNLPSLCSTRILSLYPNFTDLPAPAIYKLLSPVIYFRCGGCPW